MANFLAETAYLFSIAGVKYLISSLSNLNFDIIPPWLVKKLNLALLKCLEILSNCLDMRQLSNQLTDNKKVCKNTQQIVPKALFLPLISAFLNDSSHGGGAFSQNIYTCQLFTFLSSFFQKFIETIDTNNFATDEF